MPVSNMVPKKRNAANLKATSSLDYQVKSLDEISFKLKKEKEAVEIV